MDQQALAPIVLFVYNRPVHTEKVLKALANNPLAGQSKLYIFADGPKENATLQEIDNITQTRKLIKSQSWCKEVQITEQEKNKGLAKSIIDGVSEIVNLHTRVIVLEDDIIVSSYFLNYMNQALSIYENEAQVMHIGSFVPQRQGQEKLPETFFLRYMNCWGWGTWKRAWDKLELNSKSLHQSVIQRADVKRFELGNTTSSLRQLKDNETKRINTWAIKWYSTIFLQNGLCLYPKQSLSQQIGMDGSGVHCGLDDLGIYNVALANYITIKRIDIKEHQYAYNYLKNFYRYGNFSGFKALRHRVRIYKQILFANFESLTHH